MKRELAWLLLLSAALPLAACRTGGVPTPLPAPPPTPSGLPESPKPFYDGTPVMQGRVAREIARFESEDLKQRLEAASQLGRLGEPAANPLLRTLAEHPSGRTRGMAAYTLGFLQDHRTLDPLARALSDPDPEVRSEAATALARNGDDRGLATLIAGLEDSDPRVRVRSIAVLQGTVGESLGYAPDDDPLDRQAAVARWKGWLRRRRELAG